MARMRIRGGPAETGPTGAADAQRLAAQVRSERRSLVRALLASVLVHLGLLSLNFGIDGQGLPGLRMPWRDRRIDAPDLHVVLVAPPPAAAAPKDAPPDGATLQATVAAPPTPPPPAPPVAALRPRAAVPAAAKKPAAKAPAAPARPRGAATEAAVPPPRDEAVPVTDRAPPAPPGEPTPVVHADFSPTSPIAVSPAASSPDPMATASGPADRAAQGEARAEAARQEDGARLEAERREAQRQAAAREEARRQELARAEVARLEAERREAVLRAIGRQLDAEAARRDAAASRPANALPYSLSTARRVRLWGRSDPNVHLVEYAEAWTRKLQFNTPVESVRALAKLPHRPPVVTVAVRSDGSVESVSFVMSSGVPEVDDAIRRMVENQRPYPAFPPVLARDVDVIEIRRTWTFDDAVRLQ